MIETGKLNSDKFRLSCSLYEMVEIWSMRDEEVDLLYSDENGKSQSLKGRITNIYSRNGLEQMEVNGSIVIPTKNVILVNDVMFHDYLKS